MKRALALITITLGAILIAPATASAHTPSVSDSCSGLEVTLTNYESTSGPAFNNRVTVTIDGAAQVFDFDASFTQTFGWAQTADHTWTVVIDANRNNGNATQYDTSFQGSENACQQPSTTTSTTTLAPTTTSTSTSVPTPTSSTTVPSTSSTNVVTTTAPETTPSTSSPATSTDPSTTSTTTTVSGATTTTVALIPPPVPSTTITPNLPATGRNTGLLSLAAATVLLAGLALVAARRRL